MALRRRSASEGLAAWPGYVDALSTLLMVIIFVLLVFVLAQAFLSVALSRSDQELEGFRRRVAELSDMLSLEQGRTRDLRLSVSGLSRDLGTAAAARDTLGQRLAELRAAEVRAVADRDALDRDRAALAARLADAGLEAEAARARAAQMQAQVIEAGRRAEAVGQDAAATLAELEAARRQAAAMDRTLQADRTTIQAKLSELAAMTEENRRLAALRDELTRQAQDAAVRATTEAERRAAAEAAVHEEKRLGDSDRARLAQLSQQLTELRAQLSSVQSALDVAGAAATEKDAKIEDLGQRLNLAMAEKVAELQRYRSEFFGRMREVLANRPGIQVAGDRFVFQSEVLFPTGSSELTPAGTDRLKELAATLRDVTKDIPTDVNWLLRVDGHADRIPAGGRFASNWELSSDRAIRVVKLLIAEGIPPTRLAAAGFADFQPLDNGDGPEAFARNRRIEIRLTDR